MITVLYDLKVSVITHKLLLFLHHIWQCQHLMGFIIADFGLDAHSVCGDRASQIEDNTLIFPCGGYVVFKG